MGTNTPVSVAAVTVTVTPDNSLTLDPSGGDITMAPGLDTITFTLQNENPVVSARFTNTGLTPPEPDPFYIIRSAGPDNKLSYSRTSDSVLTVTNDNRSHPGSSPDWMWKYGIRVAVTDGNGNTTVLTYDPTIDDEGEN